MTTYAERWKLSKEWWEKNKPNYVFEPAWFEAFEKIDPRLTMKDVLEAAQKTSFVSFLGVTGVVFWHGADGKSVLPVGITRRVGDEFIFCYHPDYVADPDTQPIGYNLPKTTEPFVYKSTEALLPFFDNLVAEGWLGLAQQNAGRLLNPIRSIEDFMQNDQAKDRYWRLLTFGRGFHGGLAIVDACASDRFLESEDRRMSDALQSEATLTGVQAKMLVTGTNQPDNRTSFLPTIRSEGSTHIIKIAERKFPRIVQNECLNILATRKLLPDDRTPNLILSKLIGSGDDALVVERFDRTPEGGRLHFEEMLQIADRPCGDRYKFDYKDLGDLTRKLMGEAGVEKLFKRILAQLLLGNTDSHMKNFGCWQKDGKWEFTPNYDLVSTANYGRSTLALRLNGLCISFQEMGPKKIVLLGKAFGLSLDRIKILADEVRIHVPDALKAIEAFSWNETTMGAEITKEDKAEFCQRLKGRFDHLLGTFDKYYAIQKSKESGTRSK